MAKTKKKLVIVVSPTKAKTIGGFVGGGFIVESSFGHVRDLPKSRLGIDIEHDFMPQYVIPRTVQPRVTKLKRLLPSVSALILATDEDREGEAIAWHLLYALGLMNESAPHLVIERIVFHEITKSAIDEALSHPRDIDMNLVNAQQARRVLDRLVGYKLSPFLWKKVAKGLSAGRVQSVALRLIVEREREVAAFVPQEYWTVTAILRRGDGQPFEATLSAIDGKRLEQFDLHTGAQARAIVEALKGESFVVAAMERTQSVKRPFSPFITSTLQQEAARRFKFSAKRTMRAAQTLYENGLITYMRTDSTNLSREAIGMARRWIETSFAPAYLPAAPRIYKTKSRVAQEAHEAIRPTDAAHRTASDPKTDETRLYDLIWRRFIASQMNDARIDTVGADIAAGAHTFRATGTTIAFDGFLAVWKTALKERELPALAAGERLDRDDCAAHQHFTEPPARYNEAALIKALERHGIGRPSTYASIISVIQTRNYVEKQQGRFHPTEIGGIVTDILVKHFPRIVDIGFTAKMEEELDDIAEGKRDWQASVKDFYGPFANDLERNYETVARHAPAEPTDIACEKCGKPMVIKFGRFGKFLACAGFPDCKNTKSLGADGTPEPPKEIGMKCPICSTGEVVEKKVQRRGRARGKTFWGCSRYPACDYATWTDPREPQPEPKTPATRP
ncbi:MAG: type I DNA topoisomerase [Candidatus Liptonbacteria bacterium]|nr:type I DNA topoisomerase [Candidatus Liptonbacteria bacterium]